VGLETDDRPRPRSTRKIQAVGADLRVRPNLFAEHQYPHQTRQQNRPVFAPRISQVPLLRILKITAPRLRSKV